MKSYRVSQPNKVFINVTAMTPPRSHAQERVCLVVSLSFHMVCFKNPMKTYWCPVSWHDNKYVWTEFYVCMYMYAHIHGWVCFYKYVYVVKTYLW